jgi:hypothetical protein
MLLAAIAYSSCPSISFRRDRESLCRRRNALPRDRPGRGDIARHRAAAARALDKELPRST